MLVYQRVSHRVGQIGQTHQKRNRATIPVVDQEFSGRGLQPLTNEDCHQSPPPGVDRT